MHVCSVTGVALALLRVARCPLHAACCMLQAAWCMQHDAYSMVRVACCMMPVHVARCLWRGKGHRARCSTSLLHFACPVRIACCVLSVLDIASLGVEQDVRVRHDERPPRDLVVQYRHLPSAVPVRSCASMAESRSVDLSCDLCIEAPVSLSFHLSVDLSITTHLSTYLRICLSINLPFNSRRTDPFVISRHRSIYL
jgi:hypothetical protein